MKEAKNSNFFKVIALGLSGLTFLGRFWKTSSFKSVFSDTDRKVR